MDTMIKKADAYQVTMEPGDGTRYEFLVDVSGKPAKVILLNGGYTEKPIREMYYSDVVDFFRKHPLPVKSGYQEYGQEVFVKSSNLVEFRDIQETAYNPWTILASLLAVKEIMDGYKDLNPEGANHV